MFEVVHSAPVIEVVDVAELEELAGTCGILGGFARDVRGLVGSWMAGADAEGVLRDLVELCRDPFVAELVTGSGDDL